MHSINYGTSKINYVLHKQDRRDVKITVDLVDGVVVYAPVTLTEDKVKHLISQKARWISAKLAELDEVQTNVQPKEFVSGEKLPYLGRKYRLKVHREPVDKASIGLKQGKFKAVVPKNWPQDKVQTVLESQLIEWYRYHGLKKITERSSHYENLLGVTPTSINLRTQHKRWGTCTPKGHIYLNWRLVMAPIRVIDYVIVHELAHLLERDHNKQFWNLVKSILPNYEQQKEWLRVNGTELYCIDT